MDDEPNQTPDPARGRPILTIGGAVVVIMIALVTWIVIGRTNAGGNKTAVTSIALPAAGPSTKPSPVPLLSVTASPNTAP
jgi:hypothetical protein